MSKHCGNIVMRPRLFCPVVDLLVSVRHTEVTLLFSRFKAIGGDLANGDWRKWGAAGCRGRRERRRTKAATGGGDASFLRQSDPPPVAGDSPVDTPPSSK